jgi:PPK2 family polyphosphate:nucleotide phosphotransferase
MRPSALSLLLFAAALTSVSANAQMVEGAGAVGGSAAAIAGAAAAAPMVPAVPHGAFVSALNTQAVSLSAALTSAPLPQAFATTLAAAPVAAAATPEAFAARTALVSALASPEPAQALPALAAAVRGAGGEHSETAAKSIEKLARAIADAPASQRRGLAGAAAALNARFDGASAAPGESIDFSAIPTIESDMKEKKARRLMKDDRRAAMALQEALAASKQRAVLIVLQGMDAAGKDGVVKRPLRLNPAWTKVASFKKPTAEEAKQDFLDRVKKQLPQKGIIGVFNRSHYEDLVVPKVYGGFSPEEIEARYRRINEFERELVAQGVLIIKIFLHESKDVQKERLQDRLDTPAKRWKFSLADLETRKHWDEFHRAYAEVIARTSTPWAPWRVVGADDKPTRDARVARLLRKSLARLGLTYPEPPETKGVKIPD